MYLSNFKEYKESIFSTDYLQVLNNIYIYI